MTRPSSQLAHGTPPIAVEDIEGAVTEFSRHVIVFIHELTELIMGVIAVLSSIERRGRSVSAWRRVTVDFRMLSTTKNDATFDLLSDAISARDVL